VVESAGRQWFIIRPTGGPRRHREFAASHLEGICLLYDSGVPECGQRHHCVAGWIDEQRAAVVSHGTMFGKFPGDGVTDLRQLGLHQYAATYRAARQLGKSRGHALKGNGLVDELLEIEGAADITH